MGVVSSINVICIYLCVCALHLRSIVQHIYRVSIILVIPTLYMIGVAKSIDVAYTYIGVCVFTLITSKVYLMGEPFTRNPNPVRYWFSEIH